MGGTKRLGSVLRKHSEGIALEVVCSGWQLCGHRFRLDATGKIEVLAATRFLKEHGLESGGGRLSLEEVRREAYEMTEAPADKAARIRVQFLTPFCTRTEDTNSEAIAMRLPHVALVRAMKLYESFSGRLVERLPYQVFPNNVVRIAASRLYRYEFERQSYRQGRIVPMRGVVGWMEMEGDVNSAWPILKAAEWFHAGQKSTFGFGQIAVQAV